MTWAARFTAEMLTLKRAGHTFDNAWRVAAARHPIDTRELGGSYSSPTTLFESASGAEAQQLAIRWWQGVCRAAWDNAPALDGSPSRLNLLPGLLDATTGRDDSSFARHAPTRSSLTSGFAA